MRWHCDWFIAYQAKATLIIKGKIKNSPFSCVPGASTISPTAKIAKVDTDTTWLQVCHTFQTYIRLVTSGPHLDCTYLDLCVLTTIEVDWTVGGVKRFRSSIKWPFLRKSHLDDSSCCWKEQTSVVMCPGSRNSTTFISVALCTAHYTVSYVSEKCA